MPRKPESRLQLRIQKALAAEFGDRCWGFKVWGGEFQRTGLPDHVYCIDGLFFAFEVKRPGEEPSELQKYEIAQIRKAGGIADIVTSPDEAIELVRSTLARAAHRR